MTFVAGSLAGKPVRRVEDGDLLRGLGTYVDNLQVDDMVFLAFVRSPAAHAEIRSVEVSEAQQMPGVVAVYTADDLELPDYIGFLQVHPGVHASAAGGRARVLRRRPGRCRRRRIEGAGGRCGRAGGGRVRAASGGDRHGAGARRRTHHCSSSRSRATWSRGPGTPTAPTPLGGADVVVRGRFENQRVAVVPMEGSAIAVVPGAGGSDYRVTVYVACQMPHLTQGPDRDRPSTCQHPRCGWSLPTSAGAFGAKHLTAEGHRRGQVALELGRPVKWVETRSENMVAMPHGRGQVQYVEMGLNARRHASSGCAAGSSATPGAYAGFGGMLPGMMTQDHGPGLLPHPEDLLRRRGGAHQHHAHGRLPRRRTARGGRVPRADDGHGRRRARDRSGRAAPAQPASARPSSRTRP